jgi:hypothetical protein
MRSGPTSRVLLALAATGLLLGAAGCTADQHTPARPTLAKATADTVTVAAQSDAAERSVRVSRALFATAPGAVVAPADDASAVRAAASAAEAAHVPVLLAGKDDAPVGRELKRLGADWYQAEGDVSVDTDVPEQDAPDRGDAPESSRASRQATVVVADASADAAVVATAKAAGAHVVTMPSGVTDPAAAPGVVTALHDRADHPTVLVGAAFDDLGDP